jgi:hypothetical protein
MLVREGSWRRWLWVKEKAVNGAQIWEKSLLAKEQPVAFLHTLSDSSCLFLSIALDIIKHILSLLCLAALLILMKKHAYTGKRFLSVLFTALSLALECGA